VIYDIASAAAVAGIPWEFEIPPAPSDAAYALFLHLVNNVAL
jgi:hypothetical protein